MNKLSAKHFILFVFGVTYISFKTYPSLFIKEGGRRYVAIYVNYIFNILCICHVSNLCYGF